MQELTAALLARADELMVCAPGRVHVRRISHIDEVQLLRSVRESLADDEREVIDSVRFELMERLDGIEAPSDHAKPDRSGLFGRFLAALDAAQDAITVMRPNSDSGQELPQRLPAPLELIDAAEAWLLSHLCADRLDADLSILSEPWEEATVEAVGPDVD